MFNNKNLYPTPDWLIDKMLSKVELRGIRNVLEPSAGMGNIIKRVEDTLGKRGMEYCNIDAIEIDRANLVPILKENNIKVVHDDFLTFESAKAYGLIIMNPPFDNGVKHLLKAIELQEKNGGEVVCLLNANTITNTYSNDRKHLEMLIEKYNASVEYIDNAFTDADRKTNVKTALIHLKIDKKAEDSIIINHLKKEEEYKQQVHEQTQIVHGDFLQQIVAKYNFEVNAGVKLINEYEKLAPLLSIEFDKESPILELIVYDEKYSKDYDSLINRFIKKTRYKFWRTLFSSKEFSNLLTNDLRDKYSRKMEELQEYDFSLYNIDQIKLDIQMMLSESLENTIYSLFEDLTKYAHWHGYEGNIHYYNGWRTNKAEKINDKRNILPWSAYGFWGDRFDPSYYSYADKIKDIHKVFTYLDNGQTMTNDDILETLKKASNEGQTKNIDLEYFSITCYSKTTHFTWKRKDLVQKLNILGSKHKSWLPPDYGQKPYSSMTQEEKDVIDSFQGAEEYNKVMKDRQFYLNIGSNLLAITG